MLGRSLEASTVDKGPTDGEAARVGGRGGEDENVDDVACGQSGYDERAIG